MDIRVSPNNQSFSGYKSKFSGALDRAIVARRSFDGHDASLLTGIRRICDKKINSKSKLGSGYFSSVYRLDDKYVLKAVNGTKKVDISEIVLNKKPKFGRLKCYFGEQVATLINTYGTNLSILRNVYSKGKPIPAGIPEVIAKKQSYFLSLDYYKNTYLPMFSALPQRSFDGIARDCAELNNISRRNKCENPYIFDYINPNNFVLAGKSLRIIDEVAHASQKGVKNSVADLFNVFISNFDLDYVEAFSPEIVDARRIIAKKLILSGVKYRLPMSPSKTEYGQWIEGLELLDLDISEKTAIDMAKKLDFIATHTKNPRKRVKLAEKYLNNIFNKQ